MKLVICVIRYDHHLVTIVALLFSFMMQNAIGVSSNTCTRFPSPANMVKGTTQLQKQAVGAAVRPGKRSGVSWTKVLGSKVVLIYQNIRRRHSVCSWAFVEWMTLFWMKTGLNGKFINWWSDTGLQCPTCHGRPSPNSGCPSLPIAGAPAPFPVCVAACVLVHARHTLSETPRGVNHPTWVYFLKKSFILLMYVLHTLEHNKHTFLW